VVHAPLRDRASPSLRRHTDPGTQNKPAVETAGSIDEILQPEGWRLILVPVVAPFEGGAIVAAVILPA
jgi:hypothetical protein